MNTFYDILKEVEEHAGFKKGDIVIYRSNPRSVGKIIAIYSAQHSYGNKISPYTYYIADVSCISGKINRYYIYRLMRPEYLIDYYQAKVDAIKSRVELAERL